MLPRSSTIGSRGGVYCNGEIINAYKFFSKLRRLKRKKKKMFEISRDREGISQRQKRERKKEEEEKKIPEISNVIGTKGTFIMKAARFINFHRGREVPLLSKSPSAIINERRVTMKEQHRQHVLSFDGITLIR